MLLLWLILGLGCLIASVATGPGLLFWIGLVILGTLWIGASCEV